MDVALTSARRPVNGIELHVMEAGPADGPLLIMLHGFPDTWWTWTPQIGPLVEQGFRVIIPDLRGYNLSDKPTAIAAYTMETLVADVIGLADADGRRTFRLVGHDWGGVIAYATALRHPDRVERMAAIAAPHPRIRVRQAVRRRTQMLRSLYILFFQLPRLPEALLQARGFAVMRWMLNASSRRGLFSSEELDRYVAAWEQPGALTAMLNYYRALRLGRGGAPRLRLSAPTLIIWGGRDIALLSHLFEASLDQCDRAEGLFLDRAGHWVHLEEPAIVSDALVRFLAKPVRSGALE